MTSPLKPPTHTESVSQRLARLEVRAVEREEARRAAQGSNSGDYKGDDC